MHSFRLQPYFGYFVDELCDFFSSLSFFYHYDPRNENGIRSFFAEYYADALFAQANGQVDHKIAENSRFVKENMLTAEFI